MYTGLCYSDNKVKSRYYDRGTKAPPPLQIVVPMTVQQRRSTWSPAIVVEKHEAPRSFKVKTEDGQILSGQYLAEAALWLAEPV